MHNVQILFKQHLVKVKISNQLFSLLHIHHVRLGKPLFLFSFSIQGSFRKKKQFYSFCQYSDHISIGVKTQGTYTKFILINKQYKINKTYACLLSLNTY